jgi:hypothetical protein
MKMDVAMINSGKAFFRPLVLICSVAVGLGACGGGGSAGSSGNTGSSSSTAVKVTPTPSITLTASKPKIMLGDSVDVTLDTKDAAACISTPTIGLTGTSGTYTVKDLTPGVHDIKVTCTNEDKSATKSVQVIVPLPVFATSYENAKSEYIELKVDLSKISVAKGSVTSAFAFADFSQSGENGLMVSTIVDSLTTLGEIKFFKRDADNAWVDNTAAMMNSTDYSSCVHPRKSVIADFNNDNKPDVFFACHGSDFFDAKEPSVLVLSNANGKYDKSYVEATSNGYSHGASAADINNDNNIDIVIIDPTRNAGTTPIYVLYGNGNGTFNVDYSRLPNEMINDQTWYSAELIDMDNDGTVELIAGGHEYSPNNERKENWYAPTTIFALNQGYFDISTILPRVDAYGVVLDFVKKDSVLYVLRSNIDEVSKEFYTKAAIQKINLTNMSSSIIYEHSGEYVSNAKWIDWIGLSNGKIISLDWRYGLEIDAQ